MELTITKFCSNFKDNLCILCVYMCECLYKYTLGKVYAWRFREVKHWLKMIRDCKKYSCSWLVYFLHLLFGKRVCFPLPPFFFSLSFFSNRIIVPGRLAKISLQPVPLTLPMLISSRPQNMYSISDIDRQLLKQGRCHNTLLHGSQKI